MYHCRLSKLTAALVAMLCLAQGSPATAAGEVTSMKETIATTLAYNPNIKAFQEYRQAAEHDLSRARSGWFPGSMRVRALGLSKSTTLSPVGATTNRAVAAITSVQKPA